MSSFSFRNIFSPDDADLDPVGPKRSLGAESGGEARGASPLAGDAKAGDRRRSFLASELLPYIPKAIAAQSGIPMDKEVFVSMPPDGSLDVRLSTLYNACPELFAAEITPLNDSDVTLPPRLGGDGDEAESTVPLERPSLLAGFKQAHAENPFQPPLQASAAKPDAATKKETNAGDHDASAANVFASPLKDSGSGSSGFESGFAAFEKMISEETPEDSHENPPKSGFFGFDQFFAPADPAKPPSPAPEAPKSGTGGFETLFSQHAAADAALPSPADSAGDETEGDVGVWGAMFSGSAFSPPEETAPKTPFEAGGKAADEVDSGLSESPFDSIGNLLKQGIPSPEAKSEASSPSVGFSSGGFGISAPASAISETEVVPETQAASEESPAEPIPSGFSPFAPSQPIDEAPPETSSTNEPQGPSGAGHDVFAAAFAKAAAAASIDSGTAPEAEKEAVASAAWQAAEPGDQAAAITQAADSAFAAAPEAEPQPHQEPEPATIDGAPWTDAATASAKSAPPALPDPEPTSAIFGGFAEVSAPAASPPPTPTNDAVNGIAAPITPGPEAGTGFSEPAAATSPNHFPTPFSQPGPAPAPVSTTEPSTAAASQPAPAPEQPQAASAPGKEEDEDLRDLELRAIFSTSDHFTLSLVARRVVGLPGINSCSLSTPAKLVQASRREESRLGSEAKEMVSTLRNLAKLTGLSEARTFTLQTDRGVLSLFLEGECCVLVQQETATFEPGVREKLILVARSLVKLRE